MPCPSDKLPTTLYYVQHALEAKLGMLRASFFLQATLPLHSGP